MKLVSFVATPFISMIRRTQEMVHRKQAGGAHIIDMTIGAPNHRAYAEARQAADEAVADGKLEYYAPIDGFLEVRQTVAKYVNHLYGSAFTEKNIVVTNAGTQAIYNALRLSVDIDDHVLTTCPTYPLHESPVRFCGGKTVLLHTKKENGFVPTREQFIKAFADSVVDGKQKIVSVVLDYPNNPTGAILTEKQATEIAGALDELLDLYPDPGFSLVLDEVYVGLSSKDHCSLYSKLSERMKRDTIIILSASKAACLPGARAGASVAREDLTLLMKALQGGITNAASSTAQESYRASLEVLMRPGEADKVARYYKEKTDFVTKRLNEIAFCMGSNSLSVHVPPAGALYVFADLSYMIGRKVPECFRASLGKDVVETDMDIATILVEMSDVGEKTGVAIVPGSGFNMKPEQGYARFTCSAGIPVLTKAMNVIEAAAKLQLD